MTKRGCILNDKDSENMYKQLIGVLVNPCKEAHVEVQGQRIFAKILQIHDSWNSSTPLDLCLARKLTDIRSVEYLNLEIWFYVSSGLD